MEATDAPLTGFETFIRRTAEKPIAITLNLSDKSNAPEEKRPWMCRASVILLKPGRDGVAEDTAEIERLGDLSEAMLKALEAVDARFVAMSTSNSVRSWLTYAAKSDGIPELVRGAFAGQTDYTPTVEVLQDPTWSVFLSLFPTAAEQAEIRYHRTIRAEVTRSRAMTTAIVKKLREKGDDMSPREINYSIDFATVEEREAFISRLDEKSFKLGKQGGPIESRRGLPYSLNVNRVDPLDLAQIFRAEQYLIKLATNHDGKYDGWGCLMQPPGSMPKKSRT